MYAAAQVAEALDSLQSSARVVGQEGQRGGQQVAEGFAVAPPDAAAHLVKVRETEGVSRVDDDGVRIGNVDAVLDDGGRNQYVVIVIDKAHDDTLQLLGRHLSVSDGHAGVRHVLVEQFGQVGQGGDAVGNNERLPVPAHLEVHRVGDDFVAKGVDLGLYRVAVGRRRLDDGKVARAHQGKLQRTRNRRSGHCEGVDVDLELAELFLDGDAELLFLVNDEQAEVLELHALADELVRPDDDVHVAGGQVLEHGLGLRRGAGAGQVVHPDGKVLQPAGERLVVLEGQDGGRDEHGHLLVVAGGLESGTDGYLGLAEPYVAADEAVHGPAALHVGLHFLGDAQLVRRVFVNETGFQFVLQERVGTESEAPLLAAAGVEADEVARDVLNLLLRAFFHLLPRAGA